MGVEPSGRDIHLALALREQTSACHANLLRDRQPATRPISDTSSLGGSSYRLGTSRSSSNLTTSQFLNLTGMQNTEIRVKLDQDCPRTGAKVAPIPAKNPRSQPKSASQILFSGQIPLDFVPFLFYVSTYGRHPSPPHRNPRRRPHSRLHAIDRRAVAGVGVERFSAASAFAAAPNSLTAFLIASACVTPFLRCTVHGIRRLARQWRHWRYR